MPDEFVWTTKDGQRIALRNMSDSHIANVERFLLKGGSERLNPNFPEERRIRELRIIRDERKRRELQLLPPRDDSEIMQEFLAAEAERILAEPGE